MTSEERALQCFPHGQTVGGGPAGAFVADRIRRLIAHAIREAQQEAAAKLERLQALLADKDDAFVAVVRQRDAAEKEVERLQITRHYGIKVGGGSLCGATGEATLLFQDVTCVACLQDNFRRLLPPAATNLAHR